MARQRRDSASQVMQRMKFDPLKALVRHVQREELLAEDQIQICLRLMDNAYPKLRSVEMKGDISTTITVEIGGSDGS